MTTRLPAEWEPQVGVMLTWPHGDSDWHDRLDLVEPVFARIGATISRYEALLSVCRSDAHAAHVEAILLAHGADPKHLLFSLADSDDTWTRDYGPLTTLDDGQARLNDFRFNGWGGKFAATRDDTLSAKLQLDGMFPGAEWRTIDLVLEGGAIETDGQGTLLATRGSIITDSRNPGKDQADLEQALTTTLGFERFLWLDHGEITGDDTDGHIDTLARFADPETILYTTAPAGDDDHPGLAAMARQLGEYRTRMQRPYRLLPLPFPGVHRDTDGRRLPATYANFLVVNRAVLLPVYGVAQDAEAVTTLRRAFPDRDVIAVDCREIICQNGSLHCLTMQFPAALALRNALKRTAT